MPDQPGKISLYIRCGLSGIDSGHVFRAALSSTSVLREQIMGESQITVPRHVYSCSDLLGTEKQDPTRTFLNMHFPLVPQAMGGSGVPQSVLGWRRDREEGLGEARESMAGVGVCS